MVHESFWGVICRVVISPVSIPCVPVPLLAIIPVNPNVVHSLIEACCVILEPLPFVIMVSLDKSRLMVEAPSVVELAVPLPEPLPKINILLSPRDPAQIVFDFVLLMLLRQNLTHSVSE